MILFHLLENKLKIGGMIRCIRNDYNLDKVENEINRTNSENTLIKEKKHSRFMYIPTTISTKI